MAAKARPIRSLPNHHAAPVVVRQTFALDVLHEELHIDYETGDGIEMLGENRGFCRAVRVATRFRDDPSESGRASPSRGKRSETLSGRSGGIQHQGACA